MDAIFSRIFEISTELGRMHEFCLLTENIHKIAKCEEKECEFKTFLDALKKSF